MIERRMRMSILAVASFWYTAWVNAGQPEFPDNYEFTEADKKEFEALDAAWKRNSIKGRAEEE